MQQKPRLSFWQIWNMSFGFLGIQFGYALQSGFMTRVFETLGADEHSLPLLWLAAPLTGLIVQPINHIAEYQIVKVDSIIFLSKFRKEVPIVSFEKRRFACIRFVLILHCIIIRTEVKFQRIEDCVNFPRLYHSNPSNELTDGIIFFRIASTSIFSLRCGETNLPMSNGSISLCSHTCKIASMYVKFSVRTNISTISSNFCFVSISFNIVLLIKGSQKDCVTIDSS